METCFKSRYMFKKIMHLMQKNVKRPGMIFGWYSYNKLVNSANIDTKK